MHPWQRNKQWVKWTFIDHLLATTTSHFQKVFLTRVALCYRDAQTPLVRQTQIHRRFAISSATNRQPLYNKFTTAGQCNSNFYFLSDRPVEKLLTIFKRLSPLADSHPISCCCLTFKLLLCYDKAAMCLWLLFISFTIPWKPISLYVLDSLTQKFSRPLDLRFIYQSSRDVPMVTSFGAESAKLACPTFIHRNGIAKRIGRSQRRYEKIKWRCLLYNW